MTMQTDDVAKAGLSARRVDLNQASFATVSFALGCNLYLTQQDDLIVLEPSTALELADRIYATYATHLMSESKGQ